MNFMKSSRRIGEGGLPLIVSLLFVLSGLFLAQRVGAVWQPETPSSSLPYNSTLPLAGASAEASLNWSGYTATDGQYTAVGGTWIVPKVDTTHNTSLSADATWVGIGGITHSDLIQAGTQAIIDAEGNIVYQPWIETIPGDSNTVPLQVHPGDSISVRIVQLAEGIWRVSLKDNTTHRSYETTIAHQSSLSSAEWIEEMPSLASGSAFIPLDYFGAVHFLQGNTVKNGTEVSIAGAGAEALSMKSMLGEGLAAPTVLGQGGVSFSVLRSNVSADIALVRHHHRLTIYFSGRH
jgi:hypothetical protein